jgi:phytoene/squalene synthetase
MDFELSFEDILTNPILDIAARFWDEDRYGAFKICYRSMRVIDDMVDKYKELSREIIPEERDALVGEMHRFLRCIEQGHGDDLFQQQLIDTIQRFKIPIWPWKRLVDAMIYDLEHSSHSSFSTFLRYAEGAAVAPASIFIHLCGLKLKDGEYIAPRFDIRKTARPLAVFSYLVHTIRDFRKDQLSNLNNFADDLVRKHGLHPSDLKRAAERGIIGKSIRRLMKSYVHFTEYYRRKARRTVDSVMPALEEPYQLSLEIVYSLYSQVYERISPESGNFTSEELSPNPAEIRRRIEQTVAAFTS